MDDFFAGVAVTLLILAGLAVLAYVVLRRLFERTAQRVADDLGRVLAGVSAPAGRASRWPPRPSGGGTVTRMRAYAAARGLSEDEARREFADSIERLARLMDGAVRVPIVGPVGLDPLLGLFPVAGDVISAGVAVTIIARSMRYGVPPELIARMLANVLFDFLVGAIPVAGDLADLWFRANLRNVELLREYLAIEESDVIDTTATRE